MLESYRDVGNTSLETPCRYVDDNLQSYVDDVVTSRVSSPRQKAACRYVDDTLPLCWLSVAALKGSLRDMGVSSLATLHMPGHCTYAL